MKKLLVAAAACSLLLLAGCGDASDPDNVGASSCAPVDYYNGVYYFPCHQADFGNALSSFIRSNPGMTVQAVTGDGTGGYGRDDGYFVVTKTSSQ
jgi:hypothetical protein